MDGVRLSSGLGGLGERRSDENRGEFLCGAGAIIRGRCLVAAGSRTACHPRQPGVADTGGGVSVGCGAGAYHQADRSRHDPQQLCIPDDDLVVADGLAASIRNVALSEEGDDWDRHTRLESFLHASSVQDAGDAAAHLVREFPTLSDLLSAEPVLVADYAGAEAARALHAAHGLMIAALEERVTERAEISNAKDAEQFLHQLIGFRCAEVLAVLFLNCSRKLIGHEIVGEGRIDSVDFDPRRILLRAIGRGAAGIIVAHNHPSGDPAPSQSDLLVTRQIALLAEGFGIALHDHLVVARGRMRSAMFDR